MKAAEDRSDANRGVNRCNIVNEALAVSASVFSGLSAIATTRRPSTTLTTALLSQGQQKDIICLQFSWTAERTGSEYCCILSGFLVCILHKDEPIQKMIRNHWRRTFYWRMIFPTSWTSSRVHNIRIIRRQVYWQNMANDLYTAVKSFRDYARSRVEKTKTWHLNFFSAIGPFELNTEENLTCCKKQAPANNL